MKITAGTGDTLKLAKNKKLWVTGRNESQTFYGDTLLFKNGSTLILDNNAEIFQYFGGKVIYENGVNIKWNNLSCNRAFENSELNFAGGSHTVSNGGFIVIDGNADLKLGNNTILTFDGPGTFLKLKPNSDVILGSNAKIVFKNGARIIADSADFVSYNGTATWRGIVLENSGEDSITYCNFENTDTCIYVNNANKCDAMIKKVITGNTFDEGIVLLKNVFQCNISQNAFTSTSSEFGLLIVSNNVHPNDLTTCTETENPPPSVFGINIVNNSFDGGAANLYLNCLASSLTQFYVSGNSFNGTNSSPQMGIVTNKVTGDIKNNNFYSDDYEYAIRFYQSDLNFMGNEVNSESGVLEILTSSIANLAPVNNSGNLYWYGGINTLNAGYTGITFDAGSELY